MSKLNVLVVYYSESGHTKAAAEGIAAALDADTAEIVSDDFHLPGFLGFFQRGMRALRRKGAHIMPPAASPEEYDLVIVGSPVWASHVAPPVRTYLELIRPWPGAMAFFVTVSGQGALSALADMAELAGRQPVARMTIDDNDRAAGDDHEKIANFVASLQTAINR